MIRNWGILALMCSCVLSGCTRQDSAATTPINEAASPAPTNRIDIPSTVRSNLGITFAKVERRRVESTIRVPGAFELQPLARHEYRMTLSGRVELRVDQYQEVTPGDLLYRFRSSLWPEIQYEIIAAEQDIDSAHAEIDVARAWLDEANTRLALMRDRLVVLAEAEFRQADLAAQASELEATLPRRRAELRHAETKLANAHRAREHALHNASAATGIAESALVQQVEHGGNLVPAYRTIDWIEVHATESGVVESLALTDGAYAEAPSLVVSTVDPSKVRFRAMALQSDLVRLISGIEGRIVPPVSANIAINDAISATITIGLEAHPEQRTVTLLAVPDDTRSWIRPGVSAFLEVVVKSTGGPALAIPIAAVVKDGIVHVYFRRDPEDPNRAIRTEADMGVSDGRWVAIRSGLSLNDEVVLHGAYEMKIASQQSGAMQKGGHFHADGSFHGEH